MKKLKSLQDHNADRWADYQQASSPTYPRPNGIACPMCGAELFDSDSMIFTSNPGQVNTHCACGWHGKRIV